MALITQLTTTCIAQETTIPAPAAAVEQDEFIQSFIKTLSPNIASQVNYKDGKLIIQRPPWDSSPFYTGLVLMVAGAISILVIPAALISKSEALLILALPSLIISPISLASGIIMAGTNQQPDEFTLTFDDYGLSLNGKLRLTWQQIDDMVTDTATLYTQSGTFAAEETILKIFDRFRNQLLWLSTKCPLGVNLNNVIALIKHYREKTNQNRIIISENKTTIQKQDPQVIYVPTFI